MDSLADPAQQPRDMLPLFAIWSYADFATQMSLVMSRNRRRKDFDDAKKLIVEMVVCAGAIPPN